MENLREIVAISACRTPMGKFGGSLREVMAYDLGGCVIREAIRRTGIQPEAIDEVIMGHCRQAGNGPNPSRTAALRGGLPVATSTQTVNMACPSGMKAVALAAQAIRLGEANFVLAGGMESMSTMPYLLRDVRWAGFKMGDRVLEDGWNDSIDPVCGQGMGETGESLAAKYQIAREEQDAYALGSHRKAAAAQDVGLLDQEIVPVEIPGAQFSLLSRDEPIRRDTSLEKLSSLRPLFKPDGTITAGNACGLSDGAAALVITSREIAQAEGVPLLFSVVAYAQRAVENEFMGEGPTVTIPEVLATAGMELSDIDLLEVTEAFAAQILANEAVLKWDRERLNVHGGTIALGHPTGTTGARFLVTLYHALKARDGELGLASLCGAGGVSTSMIIKREL